MSLVDITGKHIADAVKDVPLGVQQTLEQTSRVQHILDTGGFDSGPRRDDIGIDNRFDLIERVADKVLMLEKEVAEGKRKIEKLEKDLIDFKKNANYLFD